MLGIIIGVCAVIVIVGLGNGMQGYIEDSFADMGTDSLTVIGRWAAAPPAACRRSEMYQLVDGQQRCVQADLPHGHHERLGEDRQRALFPPPPSPASARTTSP